MAYTTFKPIVTSGMVLHFDAANRRSFVSGSTSWYDLSGNGITGTLNNMGSTGYTSSNGGVIVTDGTNDFISVVLPTIGTNYTISIWLKLLTLPSPLVETQVFASSTDIASISIYNTRFGSWNGSTYRQPNKILSANVWYNLVMVNTTNTVFYIDGTLDSTFANTGTLDPGTATFAAINNSRYLNAQFSNITFYNKGLSATEVSQNYNALKGRFI